MVADAPIASSLFCANVKNYKPVRRDRQSGKSLGGGPASERAVIRP